MRYLRSFTDEAQESGPIVKPVLESRKRGGFSTMRPAFRTPLDYVDRRWERIHLSFDVTVKRANGLSLPVRVLNFSNGGFLVTNGVGLETAEILCFEFAGHEAVSGRIAWNRHGVAGGSFLSPINSETLIASLETSQKIVASDEK